MHTAFSQSLGSFPTTVSRIDAVVDRAMDRVRGPELDRVFYPLSSVCDHSMLWHVIGTFRAFSRKDARWSTRFATAMGIESFVTNVVVKSVFGRHRPHRPTNTPLPYGVRIPITSSFPSGHATAAFCAATILGPGSRTPAFWYGLAAAVATSRVYVRFHHASDVVAGAAIGATLGIALRRTLRL